MITWGSRERWASFFLLLILIATLGSLWSDMKRRVNVPARETWRQAADFIRGRWENGDQVMWYPEWAGEARLALHGLELLIPPHRGEVDVGRAKRLWVIGGYGFDGQLLASGAHLHPIQPLSVAETKAFRGVEGGEVVVTLLRVDGDQVTHDLLNDLPRVEISRSSLLNSHHEECNFWAMNGWHCSPRSPQARASVERCLQRARSERLRLRSKQRDLYTLDRRRWLPYKDCKLNPTEHISPDWRVIGEQPRRCVWIAPHRGKQITLRWSPQRGADSNETLWLSYGWEDLAMRHPFRRSKALPIQLQIQSGDTVIWNQTLRPKEGWKTLQIATPPTPQVGPTSPISLIIKPVKDVEDAHLCIDLTLRAPRSSRLGIKKEMSDL